MADQPTPKQHADGIQTAPMASGNPSEVAAPLTRESAGADRAKADSVPSQNLDARARRMRLTHRK